MKKYLYYNNFITNLLVFVTIHQLQLLLSKIQSLLGYFVKYTITDIYY